MRTWIKQPDGKKQCGQIAVAVVAGITLNESILLVGKKGCTRTKDLVTALRKVGYQCPNKCRKMPRPHLAIAQLHHPNRKGWHWVVVDGDKIFDGTNGNDRGQVVWKNSWRMTSYLPIFDLLTPEQRKRAQDFQLPK